MSGVKARSSCSRRTGCSVRVPKKTKSKVDNWENAVALFLTVDEPKKTDAAKPAQFDEERKITF